MPDCLFYKKNANNIFVLFIDFIISCCKNKEGILFKRVCWNPKPVKTGRNRKAIRVGEIYYF